MKKNLTSKPTYIASRMRGRRQDENYRIYLSPHEKRILAVPTTEEKGKIKDYFKRAQDADDNDWIEETYSLFKAVRNLLPEKIKRSALNYYNDKHRAEESDLPYL